MISKEISKRVDEFDPLQLFSIDDFNPSREAYFAIAKALSRMAKRGELTKVQKGVYFKPKKSRFGPLIPSQSQIVDFLTKESGRICGYVTGAIISNNLGLTTQIPETITIATNKRRNSGEFMGLKIRYVRAYASITKSNISLLQLLDTIKDIDHISDSNLAFSFKVLEERLMLLESHRLKKLVDLAKNYPPRAKAMLGAMLESGKIKKQLLKDKIEKLRKSIKKVNKYKGYLDIEDKSALAKWGIHDLA